MRRSSIDSMKSMTTLKTTDRPEASGRTAAAVSVRRTAVGLFVAIVSLFTAGCAMPGPGARPGGYDIGPLLSADHTVDGSTRVRAAGPLVERIASEPGYEFSAVRPFYSRTADEQRDRVLQEFLWPVGMHKTLGKESFSRFLTAYRHDFDRTDSGSRYRTIVFPIIYSGRDSDDERYFALFPVGGTIHEFLGRDRICFVLFPLYMQSSVNEVETHDVLWPFVSWTRGDKISRTRVFPFYGESSLEDAWKKRFVMWPIWTSVRYDYEEEKGGGFILFPIYGQIQTPRQSTRMVLPPLFRWSRSDEVHEVNCPWPFVQYSSGRVEKLYLWPLWGRRESGNERSSFLIWPIGWKRTRQNGDEVYKSLRIVPFVHYESETDHGVPPDVAASDTDAASDVSFDPDVKSRYFKLWPLMDYRREDDALRFRTLALWPAKHTAPVERNIAPLWTLYSHTRVGDESEHDVLWGLFRRRSRGGGGIGHFPVSPVRVCAIRRG